MTRILFTTLILLMGTVFPAIAGEFTGDITTVALRSGARVAINEPITLEDITDINGPLSNTLQKLPVEIRRDGRGTGLVTIQTVRELVLGAVEKSAVLVQGTTCQLRAKLSRRPATPTLSPRQPQINGATLRDQVSAHLRAMFKVNAASVRLEFDERNESLLNTLIEGRVVEVHAIGTGRRIPLSVTVYQGTRIIAEGTVRVTVSLKRAVAVTTAELARGVQITAKHLRTEQRWVPTDDLAVGPTDAIGQMTRRRVRVGETLTQAHLEPPIAIRRGDVVTVRSVKGSAAVRLRARALGDGRLGETIELEHTSARGKRADRQRIYATVLGPGRAIISTKEDMG